MRKQLVLAVVAFLVFTQTVLMQTLSPALTSLVETEKAFAAMSLEKGMKSAFIAYLADDGILFRPAPVNGKEVWKTRPDTSGAKLEWEPIYADVAASGDVGYTTGPWTFTPGPNLDQPPSYGFFVSVWKKQNDGKWKLAVDLGIGNQHPEKVDRTFSSPSEVATSSTRRGNVKAEQSRLMSLENSFSRSSKPGTASAIDKFATEGIRLYRDGDVPSLNRTQACERLMLLGEKLISRVEKVFVAPSCDLAYSYGQYDATYSEANGNASGYYLRIWKKNPKSDWKLVLDILNPTPKP